MVIEILLTVTLWYGLGFAAAAWAAHKGHAADLWVIGAALWGALMVPLIVAARLFVLARPTSPDIPTPDAGRNGEQVVLLVHVDDSPREALDPIVGMARDIESLVIIVLVSEEARSGVIATGEMAKAELSLHRILRTAPPVETSTAITSLSALDQLVRKGWRADRVAVTPQVLGRPLTRSVARTVNQLGRRRLELPRPVELRSPDLGGPLADAERTADKASAV